MAIQMDRSIISMFAVIVLLLSQGSVFAQGAMRGPDETPMEYQRRYLKCNDITAAMGKYGYTPEWNKCMRDSWATRNKSTAPPPVKKAPAKTTKPQSSGNLTDTAKVDPSWAGDTRKRISGAGDQTVDLPQMENNAPYGNKNCPLFKPSPGRGKIDWDWVVVTNRCSYPIAVLACYFDIGQEHRCLPGGDGSWATIEIKPGQTVTSIATSKRLPWQVRGVVCNMTPIQNNRMLCVLPDIYKKS